MAVPSSSGSYDVITPSTTDGTNTVKIGAARQYVDYDFGRWVAKAGCEVTVAGITKHFDVEYSAADMVQAVIGLAAAIAALL